MYFVKAEETQWAKIAEIYKEAFPKAERKPLSILKHDIKKGKAELFAAWEEGELRGFALAVPYRDMVMLDYLAVARDRRSEGTGGRILSELRKHYKGKRILLLIERLNKRAFNNEQRRKRRRFYLENGFSSSEIFMKAGSGSMEIMQSGGRILPEDFLSIWKYDLGDVLYKLSKTELVP